MNSKFNNSSQLTQNEPIKQNILIEKSIKHGYEINTCTKYDSKSAWCYGKNNYKKPLKRANCQPPKATAT